jgi:hypothetical protein
LESEFDACQRQWNSGDLARMIVQPDDEAAQKNQKCQGCDERVSVAEHEDEEQERSRNTASYWVGQFAEVIRARGLAWSLQIVEGDWVVAILLRSRFRLIG